MDGQGLRSRAIAYLISRGRNERPAVTLPMADARVLIGLCNGLSARNASKDAEASEATLFAYRRL